MKKFLFVLILLLIGVAALVLIYSQDSRQQESRMNPHKQIYEVDLGETIAEFTVFRFPHGSYNASFEVSNASTSFIEWQEQTDYNVFLNAGYFLEDYSPAGGIWIQGNQVSDRFFDLDQSGLVYIRDGRVDIKDTAAYADLSDFSQSASQYLQSYPFLIKDGETAIATDSELLARRTVLATTDDALLVILVDRTPVSLFELMNMLLDADLGITMALNLDGGPSTALHYDYNGVTEAYLPLSGLPQILGLQLRS